MRYPIGSTRRAEADIIGSARGVIDQKILDCRPPVTPRDKSFHARFDALVKAFEQARRSSMINSYTILQICVLYAVLAVGAAASAQAAPPNSDGSRLYAPCVVCHQPSAWGSTDGVIPSLAGQQKRYLEKQLTVFRSGARNDTAMQIVAVHSTFSDPRNIVALANYLSGLDANPRPVKGSGDHLRVGQELYTHICAACHGDGGQGQSGNRVPRIGGQHYPYLRRQIDQASDFHKDLAPPEMTSALRSMRSSEKDALADYISRLGPADAPVESNRHDETARYQSPQPPEPEL